MKTLTALALLVAVVAPTMSNAGCSPCASSCAPACAPVVRQQCMQPVCQSCICCPKVQGFLERNW